VELEESADFVVGEEGDAAAVESNSVEMEVDADSGYSDVTLIEDVVEKLVDQR
jgi:hypothetical protein